MASEQDSLIDLRSLESVSEYSGHLVCAVCHCAFIQPIRLRCDHIFCQTCLNACIRTAQTYVPFTPPPDSFLCPTCRTPTNASFQTVPRLILSMCDEILVKCPYVKEGCEEVIQRGHVQSHVDKYCDFRLVHCPDMDCGKKTRKKDLDPDGRCMHTLHECKDCGDSVMEQEYEAHVSELCPKLKTACPDCEVSLLLDELVKHLEDCPKATQACRGAAYGCEVKVRPAEIKEHEKTCPLSKLGPYLETQSSRVAMMESTLRQFQQRNQTLEDGIESIRATLAQATPRPVSSSSITPSTPAPIQSTNHINDAHSEQQDSSSTALSSSTTAYLLSVHESLREEVTTLSSALSNVDARANMSIMNENLRIREDMAHINAGLNTVRMQVHMLMNQRLHQGQRPDRPRGASAGATSTVDTLGAGPSRSNGPVPEPLRGRRLSDSGGTKL